MSEDTSAPAEGTPGRPVSGEAPWPGAVGVDAEPQQEPQRGASAGDEAEASRSGADKAGGPEGQDGDGVSLDDALGVRDDDGAAPAEGTGAERPEDAQRRVEELKAQLVARYALSEEDADKIASDPAQIVDVLPRKLAELQVETVNAVFAALQPLVPQVVERIASEVVRREMQRDTLERTFFDRWPQLRRHRDLVMQVGRSVRKANPNMSVDEFVERVGAAVAQLVGAQDAGGRPSQARSSPLPRPAGRGSAPGRAGSDEGDLWAEMVEDLKQGW